MSWKEIRVGNIGTVITGNTPPKKNAEYYGDAYKFIKPTDMEIGQRFTPFTEECYSLEGFLKYEKSLIPPLSTCVVTIGSIGKKITMTEEPCFVNQAVNAVIPNQDTFDPLFIFYSLKNILPKVKNADTGASSGRENVSKSNFCSLTLSVPEDINTQKKIGSILGSFDDLIENNLKRIKLLEEAAQNIYREWFVNFRFPDWENTEFGDEGLPVGWGKKNLNEIASLKYGKMPNKKNVVAKGFPIFTGYRVAGFYNQMMFKEPKLVVIARGVGGTGDVKISPRQCWLTNLSIAIECNENETYQSYLYQYLRLANLRSLDSGAAQSQITISALGKVEVIVPTIKTQANYNKHFTNISRLIESIKSQNKLMIESRDILLPRLMNRTIEV